MRLIDRQILQKLFADAVSSERRRAHYLMHANHQEKVQRLVIAMVKGSYVEPHYHELPHQWEMFIVTQGTIEVKIFDPQGDVLRSFKAGPEHDTSIVELSPGDIHSVECLSERVVMIEVKEGPFDDNFAKVFPGW